MPYDDFLKKNEMEGWSADNAMPNLPSIAIDVTQDEYNFITRYAALQADPQKAIFDMQSAILFSRNTNMPVDYCLQNLDMLSDNQIGEKYQPTQTWWKSITNSYKIGELTIDRGQIGKQYATARHNGEDYSQYEAQMKELDSQIEALQDYVPRSWITKALKATAQSIPYTANIAIARGVAGAATKAVTALIPGIADDVVVKAVEWISAIAGTAKTSDIMWGSTYYDLVNKGIDEDVAWYMSQVSGVGSGLIESALGKMLGGATRSITRAMGVTGGSVMNNLWARMIANGSLGQIAKAAGDIVTTGFGEGSEEFVESIKDKLLENLAYTLSDMDIPVEQDFRTPQGLRNNFGEALDDFIWGALSGIVMGGPTDTYSNAKLTARRGGAMQTIATVSPTYEVFSDRVDKIEGLKDEIFEGNDEQWEKTKRRIYDSKRVADARKTYFSERNALGDIEESETYDEQGNATKNPRFYDQEGNYSEGQGASRSVNVTKMSNGRYFSQDSDRKTAEGWSIRKFGSPDASEKTDGKFPLYGQIEYTQDGKGITIQNIRFRNGVSEADITGMVRQFLQENPDINVTWDAATDLERNVKESIEKENGGNLTFKSDMDPSDHQAVYDRLDTWMGDLGKTDPLEKTVSGLVAQTSEGATETKGDYNRAMKDSLATVIQLLGKAEGKTGIEWLNTYIKEIRKGTDKELGNTENGPRHLGAVKADLDETVNRLRATIYYGKNANYSTFEHELHHVVMMQSNHREEFSKLFEKYKNDKQFRDFLARTWSTFSGRFNGRFADLDQLINSLYQKDEWTADDWEFEDSLFEAYRAQDQSYKNRPLSSFFGKIASWMRQIYRSIRRNADLNPEITQYFDRLYGAEGKVYEGQDLTFKVGDALMYTAEDQTADEVLQQFRDTEARLAADPSNFDADGNHLAPNGKPSNLTYKQWVLVRTPNFVRWFGDWMNDPENASKVVDENGEPKVVYHGATATFDVFSKTSDIGYHFGTEAQAMEAQSIHYNNDAPWFGTADVSEDEFPMMQLFLNLRNPITGIEDPGTWIGSNWNLVRDLKDSGFISDSQYEDLDRMFVNDDLLNESGDASRLTSYLKSVLIENGYDGIIYKNMFEGVRGDFHNPIYDDSYMVFNSNQAKSATDNSGEFNPESDSILHQSAAGKALYVDNTTRDHFADEILDGVKTIETRTREAYRRLVRQGLKVGDRVGIIANGQLMGYVTLSDVREYANVDEFRADYDGHLVAEGSRYDYDDRGKVGLVFTDPERITPIPMPKADRIMSMRSLNQSSQAEAEAQRQYDEVVAKYKGTDQWLKAPNGKPTNLTERQWVQVRTQNFLDWFGDWINDPQNASKVLDENGEPKVMYHGTNQYVFGFDVFDTEYKNSNLGSHFGGLLAAQSFDSTGDYTYAVFLNIRNPLDVEDIFAQDTNFEEVHLAARLAKETNSDREYELIRSHYPWIDQYVNMSDDDFYYNVVASDAVDEVYDWERDHDFLLDTELYKTLHSLIRKSGHDGLVYYNQQEGDFDERSWVALNPNEIKSATNNTGEFYPENDSILHQTAQVYSPAIGLDGSVIETPQIGELRKAYANVSIEARHTELSKLGRWWTANRDVQRKFQDAYRNVFIGPDGKNLLLELAGLPTEGYESHILLGTYQGVTNVNETEIIPIEFTVRYGEDGRPYIDDDTFNRLNAAYKVKTILQRQEGTSWHVAIIVNDQKLANGYEIMLGRDLEADEDNFLQRTIAEEMVKYADEIEAQGRVEDAKRIRDGAGWQVSTIAIPGGVRIIDFNNGGRSGNDAEFAFSDHVEYSNFLKDRVLSKWDVPFVSEPQGFVADGNYIDVSSIWKGMDNGNGEWKSELADALGNEFERSLYRRSYRLFSKGLQDVDSVALQASGIDPRGWELVGEDQDGKLVQVNRRNYYPIPSPTGGDIDLIIASDGLTYLTSDDLGKVDFNPNRGKIRFDLDERLRLPTKVLAEIHSTDENGNPLIGSSVPTGHSAKSVLHAPFKPKSKTATTIADRAAKHLTSWHSDNLEPPFWLRMKEGESSYEYLMRVQVQMEKNLMAIYDALARSKNGPALIRQGRLWYDTMHAIGKNLYNNYGGGMFNGNPVTELKTVAIIAAYSPGRDWYKNVMDAAITMACVHYLQGKTPTQQMVDYAMSASGKARMSDESLSTYATTAFGDMNEEQQIAFIIGVMNMYVSRQYRAVVPGEGLGEIVSKKDGTPQLYDAASKSEVQKVVQLLRGKESVELYDVLSQAQKVRSFFNNGGFPNSLRLETTMDTHATKGGFLRAIGSGDWIPSSGTAQQKEGTSFIGAIQADAYRSFSMKIRTLPNRGQAIVWIPAQQLMKPSKEPKEGFTKKIYEIEQQYGDNRELVREKVRELLENAKGKIGLTQQIYAIEAMYASEDEANGDIIREEILKLLDFDSLTVPTTTEETRNATVFEPIIEEGSIWEGVEYDDEKARLRNVMEFAEESAKLTDETEERFFNGELEREPIISADTGDKQFYLGQSSQISDDTIEDIVDSYITYKTETNADRLTNLVLSEMRHSIDYPQREYSTVSTPDLLYNLRAVARASSDIADFMVNAEEEYGLEGQEFDVIDLQAIWDDVHTVEIENRDYGTLTEPNREVEDKVSQFTDILSDKASFEEFLKGLQNSNLEGASLFMNNLVSRLSNDETLNTEGFRIAYGQVLENPEMYMDLYGQATDNDYWKTSADTGGQIADEMGDEFAEITRSDVAEVASTIQDKGAREALMDGTETTENGAVEKALEENRKRIEELKAEKAEIERQPMSDEDSAADLKRTNRKAKTLVTNAQRILAEKSKEFRDEAKSVLNLSDEKFAKRFPTLVKELDGEEDLDSEEIFGKALENTGYLRDQISTVLQKYRQLLTAKKNLEVAKKVSKAKESVRYSEAIKRKNLRTRLEKVNQDLKDAYRERQNLKKAKAMKQALARKIMRPVSNNVNWRQARQIMRIQSQIDPNFTQRIRVNGEMMDIREAKWLFTENPDNPIFDSLSPEQMAKILNTNLNEMTIEQLEVLAMVVDQIRAEGLRERQAYIDAQARVAKSWRDRFIAELQKTGRVSDNPPMKGSQEEAAAQSSIRQKLRNANYALLNMARKAQILDNHRKGSFYDLLIRMKRDVYATEYRAIEKRTSPIEKLMAEYKIDYSDFYTNHTINVDGWKTQNLSFSQLLYYYLSANNEKNRQALAYGNLVTDAEKTGPNGIKAQADAMAFDTERDRNRWMNAQVRALGDARYRQIYEQAKQIIESKPELKPIIDAIEADLNSESFERVREIMLKVFNQEVGKEDYYLPMRRNNLKGKSAEEMMYEDIMKTVPGTRASRNVKKGMTEDRIVISPINQSSIEADFVKVWADSVTDQEHLVAALEYSKLLNSVFGNSQESATLKSYIEQAYGDAMMKDIQTHIAEIANPNASRDIPAQDQIIRYLRGGLYSAYLGFKASSIVNQAITSPAAFLGKVSPLKLMKGYLTMMAHPKQLWNTICELSPFMKSRSIDPTRQMIMDEREDAKARAKTGNKAKDAVTKVKDVSNKVFNDVGLRGLDWIDRFCVAGGWWAIYQDELSKMDGGDLEANQREAARRADEFVYETQPLSDKTELSPFFKNKNEAVNLLTQFQTSLNVVWNNITFDIPQQLGISGRNLKEKLQNGEFVHALGMIVGYAASGALLLLVTEGFDDDDDDKDKAKKVVYSFFNQPIAAIPLVSNAVDYALKRTITGDKGMQFNSSNYPLFDKMVRVPYNVVEGDWEKAWTNAWQSIALANGLPYSSINELLRIKDSGLGSLLGRR